MHFFNKRKVKKGCENTLNLIQRRLPTETHKKLWAGLESSLNFRANISMFIITVQNFLKFVTHSTRMHHSIEFIAKENSGVNQELAEMVLPILKYSYIILIVCRPLLMIVSYWKPAICRSYFYYQFLITLILLTLPIEQIQNPMM